VLGLIFLKYISDAFEAKHAELDAQRAEGADPEDPDEYRTIRGSTVDRIPLIDMPKFPILVPRNPDEQPVIARILGALDDKIGLNRRMNETMEAMARALFKSWFVDFDPVRAKAEGRESGLPQSLADMFPANLEESELGIVPQGWAVARLGEVLQQRIERCTPSAETAVLSYGPIDCISPRSLFLCDSKPGTEAEKQPRTLLQGRHNIRLNASVFSQSMHCPVQRNHAHNSLRPFSQPGNRLCVCDHAGP
jgi:hypothetical protein